MAEGKEVRSFAGREYLLEYGITTDFALVKAQKADRFGNLTYNKVARNFGPIMCMAAKTTIVQVRRLMPAGSLDAEAVVTPGIFVDRLVEIPDPVVESALISQGASYP